MKARKRMSSAKKAGIILLTLAAAIMAVCQWVIEPRWGREIVIFPALIAVMAMTCGTLSLTFLDRK